MKRKGVSTYISVLLLIVVVIAGGILIYGYTMGWFGRLGGEGEMGTLSVDTVSASVNGTDPFVTVYLRNVGGSDVTLDVAYVDDVQATSINQTTILQGNVDKIVIKPSQTLTAGNTYEIKIVAADNTQVAFSVKAE
ncbi:MAG TPA: hypothetical protein ENJ36_01835 [Candidatus Bathyarchaeota archaeon]|nr:hypothetical protein [Candidatus Bathyarchaeota archaeon]